MPDRMPAPPSAVPAPTPEPAAPASPSPEPWVPPSLAPDLPEPAGTAFTPANGVEASLLKAAEEGSTDTFLSTLLLAKVLLPLPAGAKDNIRPGDPTFLWRTEIVDDQVYVVLFTSPDRMAEFFTNPVTVIEVKFVQLIKAWPGVSWSFAVNPGSPVGAKLPGAQIVALASWAADVGLSADSSEEPAPSSAPARPVKEDRRTHTVMQKSIPASQVDFYLERGYDRVYGFVHRASEVAHLRTPAELRAALGLGYSGSPFSRDDDTVYVLRWPAYRPSLYRIPYGGQTETAMRAMEGWVIQRGPFRGNGFAPGESADVIAEFKVDSVRLPHGAELWRVKADATEELVAVLDTDGPKWRRVGES
jgi:SseB protein N-terminal domain